MSTPKTLGPYNSTSTPALVAGTAFAIAVDPSTVAIQVHNDTPYRVYVAFDGAAPTASVAATGNYQGIAGPFGHPVIMIRSQYQSPFLGTVWLMPIDLSASLAITGTASPLAEIHLDTFGANDALPQSWAMPRQQDLTSQPRIVAVPMGLSHWIQGSWGGVTETIETFTPNAAQLAASRAPIYFYYAQLATGIGSGSSTMVFQIGIQWRNNGGGAVGSPFVLVRGNVWHTTAIGASWVFNPSWPLAYIGGQSGNIPPTAVTADLQLIGVSGGLGVDYTISAFMDPSNTMGDADIGVQAVLPTSAPLPLF